MAKSTLEVTTQEVATFSTSEVPVVTSEMRKLLVQLAVVLLRETNTPPPPYENTITIIIETRSGSALPVTTPVMDTIEELTL